MISNVDRTRIWMNNLYKKNLPTLKYFLIISVHGVDWKVHEILIVPLRNKVPRSWRQGFQCSTGTSIFTTLEMGEVGISLTIVNNC